MPKNNTPPPSPGAVVDEEWMDEEEIFEEVDLDDIELEDEMSDEDMEGGEEVFIPEKDDAVFTFSGHTNSVLRCVFHPIQDNILVSAGMDNKVHVWDLNKEDRTPIYSSDEFKESVDFIKFSKSGQYLAVADLDASIRVFDASTFTLVKEFDLYKDYDNDDGDSDVTKSLEWLTWHSTYPVLIAGTPDFVIMQSVASSDVKFLSVDQPSSHYSGRSLPDGERVAVGMGDGTVRIIGLKSSIEEKTIKPFTKEEEAPSSITSLDVHPGGILVLCGSALGHIFQANVDNCKFTMFPMPISRDEMVFSISYAPTANPQKLAASGHRTGNLRIWDTNRQALRHLQSYPAGMTSMAWHPTQLLVVTCHVNAIAYILDARGGAVIRTLSGHTKLCNDVSFNMNGALLATASDDTTVKVYKTDEK